MGDTLILTLKLHFVCLPCSQRQVAERNLKEGEKREGRRDGSKTCDCHRKKKKEKKKQRIPEIFSAVLTNADMLCTHTQMHIHTESPTRLKIGQKIFPCWNKKQYYKKLCYKISTMESVNGRGPVLQQRNVLKQNNLHHRTET